MKIDLDTYCSCSHCGVKATTSDSSDKFQRELYPYETENDFMLLCIDCVKKELKLINSELEAKEHTQKSGHLLASLLNVYRKAFPLKDRHKN